MHIVFQEKLMTEIFSNLLNHSKKLQIRKSLEHIINIKRNEFLDKCKFTGMYSP